MGFDIRLAALTSQNFNGPQNTTAQRQGFKIMYSQNGPNPPRPTKQTNRAHKKHISHTHTHTTCPDFGHITTAKGKLYESLRHRRRPSWTCACANCASTRASSRCAWPNAWPSSCRPSSRRPSCARHVSWAPWFGRLGTTGAGQLLQTTRGEAQRNELKLKGRPDVHTNTPETQQSRQCTRTRPQHNNQDQGNHLMCACFFLTHTPTKLDAQNAPGTPSDSVCAHRTEPGARTP